MAILTRKRRKSGKPEWLWRRLIVFVAIGFAFWQLNGLRAAADTRVNDTLAFGYLTLVAVLVLTYAGLATAQDIAAIWATRSALPYSPDTAGPDYETVEPGPREPTPEELARGGQ